MIDRPPPLPADDRWREKLLSPSPHRNARRFLGRIPSSPRCKSCAAPFAGPGGLVMPLLGHGRWARNPKYCAGCFRDLRQNHGGAEVDCSLMFADVRGSTPLGERMPPSQVARLMGRFYDTATAVLVEQGAFVDFVGDEVTAIFVPALATEAHAQRAIGAAVDVVSRTDFLPVGAGVTSGTAYVGSVGEGEDRELTAIGDIVNTAARLASAAGAGEVLVTTSAAARGHLATAALERRSLELKGKREPTDVFVLRGRVNAT